ncbi:hypothetical protein G6F40_017200 [Rhizopus arrhizus]|nr:hypothetical protein G6F40_017200 [Rhizopus arrhizus]
MPAIAGANTDDAAPARACVIVTLAILAVARRAMQAPVTSTAAAINSARLFDVRSTRAPAGVCAASAASPDIVITNPMLSGRQ